MNVFGDDAWNAFHWELGYETLPKDTCSQLWEDDAYWDDEGIFTYSMVGTTTAATTLVENRLKSERNASSVSGLSARHSKSDAGSEVASTPILIKEECLPVEPLGGDTGMSAEPRSQLPARSANPQPIPLGRTRLFDDGQSFVIACAANDVISVEGIQFGNAQRPKKAKPNATSQFKGVTKHRVTGKFEAHLWDASVIRKGKHRRGRHRGKQIYLGSFNSELAAARTFDMAAICYWGDEAFTNFPISDYTTDIQILKATEKETIVKLLRKSEGGYPTGSDRFVGLSNFHTMQYDRASPPFDDITY